MAKLKLVYIEWEDARSIGSSWRDVKELLENAGAVPIIVKEVGWIVKEDKDTIVIVSSLDERKDKTFVSDGTILPKSLIRKRKVIKYG